MIGSDVREETVKQADMRSIYSLLREAEGKSSSFPLIVYHGKHVTYHNILSMVDSMAETLRKKFSVKKGDAIGIALPLSPQFIITFFAAIKIGAVSVPMDHLLTSWEMESVVKFTNLKVLVAVYTADITIRPGSSISGIVLTRLQEFLPFEKAVSVTAGQIAKSVKLSSTGIRTVWFSEMIFEQKGDEEKVDAERDPAAVFVFPAVDGELRGISYTTSNLLASVLGIRENILIPKTRFKIGSSTPVFSPSGFQLSVLLPTVLAGTVICSYERNDYERLGRLCSLFDCDYVCGMPNDLYWMAELKVPLQGAKSLKAALCSSYLLSRKVKSRFEKAFDVSVQKYYDVPEMSGITHMQLADRNQRKAGSIGKPIRDITAKIVDEVSGEEIEGSKPGLLRLAGPQMTEGYIPSTGEDPHFAGGFFETGDLARKDEDGHFFITDYRREFLISNDVIVSPSEIERSLLQVEGVAEAAVIGLDSGQGDERIIAVVSPVKGKKVSVDKLRDICSQRLTKEKVPSEFRIRESLPKSMDGKILKRLLVEEYLKKK